MEGLVICTFKLVKPCTLRLLLVIFVSSMESVITQLQGQTEYHEPFNAMSFPPSERPELNNEHSQSISTPMPSKKPEAFRIEDFLDRSGPTLEENEVIMRNLKNSAKIRRIFELLGNRSRGYGPRSHVHVIPKWSKNEENSQKVVHHKHQHMKQLCPETPQLKGRVIPDLSPHNLSLDVPRPLPCVARHRIALIIPYRYRKEHLTILLSTLHALLRKQHIYYRIYVVEQFGNNTFNKGVLMNAGVWESLRDDDYQCLVFHDVDLIPEDDRNLYTCPSMPRHMSVAVDKLKYTLPYHVLVGGVFSIQTDHFFKVNGYSNLYWGWGGEDDDMGYRVTYRHLQIVRPPEVIGRYTMINHKSRAEIPTKFRRALLRTARKRSSLDGLSTVKYHLLERRDTPSYTHLYIDIGQKHYWSKRIKL